MIFKLFNIEFQISVPFAVMFAFLLVTDKTGLMSASLLAVVLHEIGHLIWMKKCRTAPKSVKMSLGGVLMVGSAFCTARESISIALAGPVVNFLSEKTPAGIEIDADNKRVEIHLLQIEKLNTAMEFVILRNVVFTNDAVNVELSFA